MGFKWVQCSNKSNLPPNAVEGGRDSDGTQIYVGRANHAGDWLPAKVLPRKNAAYVAHGGNEILVHNIEILVESRLSWVPASNGHVPGGAVATGTTTSGETLFIGRAHHSGSLTVGKVHPSHRCIYIPYGGKEVSVTSYEVLVDQ